VSGERRRRLAKHGVEMPAQPASQCNDRECRIRVPGAREDGCARDVDVVEVEDATFDVDDTLSRVQRHSRRSGVMMSVEIRAQAGCPAQVTKSCRPKPLPQELAEPFQPLLLLPVPLEVEPRQRDPRTDRARRRGGTKPRSGVMTR
jgi:hypothetical protein